MSSFDVYFRLNSVYLALASSIHRFFCVSISMAEPSTTGDVQVLSTMPPSEDTKEFVSPQNLEIHQMPIATPAMRRRGWVQFSALCFTIYVSGWNEGTLGPLLPRLQEVNHVGLQIAFWNLVNLTH